MQYHLTKRKQLEALSNSTNVGERLYAKLILEMIYKDLEYQIQIM